MQKGVPHCVVGQGLDTNSRISCLPISLLAGSLLRFFSGAGHFPRLCLVDQRLQRACKGQGYSVWVQGAVEQGSWVSRNGSRFFCTRVKASSVCRPQRQGTVLISFRSDSSKPGKDIFSFLYKFISRISFFIRKVPLRVK